MPQAAVTAAVHVPPAQVSFDTETVSFDKEKKHKLESANCGRPQMCAALIAMLMTMLASVALFNQAPTLRLKGCGFCASTGACNIDGDAGDDAGVRRASQPGAVPAAEETEGGIMIGNMPPQVYATSVAMLMTMPASVAL